MNVLGGIFYLIGRGFLDLSGLVKDSILQKCLI